MSPSSSRLSTTPAELLKDTIVYPPHRGYPLHITANRYYCRPRSGHNVEDDPDALTLICLHSTSFHKETWEPTLARLFQLAAEQVEGKNDRCVNIREAWAIEAPNHGTSGCLNQDALLLPEYHNNFSCHKYADAVRHFLTAGPSHGARIDWAKCNLVGIGHSLGGVAICVLSSLLPHLPLHTLVVIEPMLSPAGPEYLDPLRYHLIKAAYERRDVWPSRQEALDALRSRPRTQKWDERVLKLFVEYAVRPHPESNHPIAPYTGFTLSCTRDQEAGMYRDVDGPTLPVQDLVSAFRTKDVHLILGSVSDFIPKEVHAALINLGEGRYASIGRVQGAGHLIPQERPDALAHAIFCALTSNSVSPQLEYEKRSWSRSKL